MKSRIFMAFVIALVLSLFSSSIVSADGIIIPDPPPCMDDTCPPIIHPMEQLVIRYHHVDITIENQVATTHVDQVFYNPNDYTIEGIYIFPIPVDAAVEDFVLWIDGEPVHGEVLDAVSARNTYEEIVRNMRDPALLEYVGRGAVQARIFPIQPQGERRIELEYSEVLLSDNDLIRYVYPLSTEKYSAIPLESVSVNIKVSTEGLGDMPIRAIYSPSHNVSINKIDEYHFTASYEENNVLPDKDFSLFYSVGKTEAFHLFTYRDPGNEKDSDGFFLLLLAPKPGDTHQAVAKDVILVLDQSGSMEGDKFKQAQSALQYILAHLNDTDRFFLLTFSDSIKKYNSELSSTTQVSDAMQWVDSQNAAGSTDINRALLEAMAVVDPEKPTYLIFLTDGLPTSGVVSTQDIINNILDVTPENVRLFSFGVGYDVDTYLLDTLSQEHHGLSTYVKPSDPLDEILSGFYEKISTPVLTNLNLDFGDISTYDIYPNPLPDFFAGSQLVVVGRYKTGGVVDIRLSGELNGEEQNFTFTDQVFEKDSRTDSKSLSGLPRLWATRKIGYLLNKIRLQGADQETIDQVVFLSIRYGIVTPYTSFLVTESMPLGEANQKDLAEETYNEYQSMPSPSASGQNAVEKAEREGEMSQAEVPQAISEEAGNLVKTIGPRTFVFTNGTWVDTQYDPDVMKTHKISFLSDDYFTFLETRPDIASALSIGQKVIVVLDGKAYEIVDEGTVTEPVNLPTLPSMTVEATPISKPTQSSVEAQTTPTVLSSPDDSEATTILDKTIQPSQDKAQNSPIYLVLGAGGVIFILIGVLILLRMKKAL